MASRMESFCCLLASLFPKVFCIGVVTWALFVLLLLITPDMADAYGSAITYTLVVLELVLYTLIIYSYFLVIRVGPGSPLDYPELRIRNIQSLRPQNVTKITSTVDGEGRHEDTEGPMDESLLDPSHESPYDDPSVPFLSNTDELVAPESPPTEFMTVHSKRGGGVVFCTKCLVWKPDRTHHCSSSGKCILRMDHYCPWFTTCIGYFNHKFFVQFLVYVSIYSGLLFGASLAVLWRFFTGEVYKTGQFLSINVVVLFVLAAAFGGATAVFAGFLVYLVLRNKTTLELHEANWDKGFQYEFNKNEKVGNIYDLGWKRNWTSIMGETWAHWLLPVAATSRSIHAKNNGINFDVDEEMYERFCQQSQLQSQLNQQLQEYGQRRRDARQN
ncbi:zf-DHHC-domain-containing protein [Suhomyces tanzawaensis NRRL Y-17324]|uniref:Palmitoyltransferase n=1 Tax=Suhomyces tanzawaensis NRRL Y-17324 TaxID=984487 RepID=A0A1E4SIN1_9ASCO|nr:zf-DHHC-domain-containing protein [Suhomyces tanzawaensis NRRL Y-17324]ODV79359.1 zf-DHHC-domain-containing protein [Suhomyces tanzawaensis NRRL Y-17324]